MHFHDDFEVSTTLSIATTINVNIFTSIFFWILLTLLVLEIKRALSSGIEHYCFTDIH